MKPVLDLEALSKIPSLALRAKILAEGSLSGLWRARRHGGSAEFAEHRLYAPGDALRTIDWKVYGRFDKYYVRKYEEERNLIVLLCLDGSGSMQYGPSGRSKFDCAVHLAAALAYLFSQERHAVGLALLGGEAKERYLPPRTTGEHTRRIFSVLEEARPTESFDFLEKLREIAERQKRRALLFFFSDLLAFPPLPPEEEASKEAPPQEPLAFTPLKLLAARGHDVILFHILHPSELSFPYEEMTEFEDLESGERLLVDASGIREAYLEEIGGFLEETKRFCLKAGIEYQRISSAAPLDETLLAFFSARGQRR